MTPGIRRAYAENIYGQLHYRIAAPPAPPTRPPLLLLHQTPRSGWELEPIMPALGVDRVVIAPDTPGYGASDPPPEPVGVEAFARAMIRLMDDLQAAGTIAPGPFDVLGYHTGSVTATQMARAWPERIRRIIPIGLAAFDQEERAEKLANIDVFPVPRANDLTHVTRLWDLMQTLFDPRTSAQWRHRALAESLMTGVRLPWGFEAVFSYDFQAAMAEVEQPVMVINLEDDLYETTKLNAHRYPNGRRVDLDGVAHGVMTLETDRMVALIRGFLDE
jgi:pimeloyl-ACP methyl ester carboxylesterase